MTTEFSHLAIAVQDIDRVKSLFELISGNSITEKKSIQNQKIGGIGGNICNASPAADSIPCLLALDAKLELSSANNQRIIPAKLPLQNCFTLLFQFEYFFMLHNCLIDLNSHQLLLICQIHISLLILQKEV